MQEAVITQFDLVFCHQCDYHECAWASGGHDSSCGEELAAHIRALPENRCKCALPAGHMPAAEQEMGRR